MSEFLRCRDCKHDKEKCVGSSRRGSHKNCFEPREMTNADRIRAMSDEELSEFISRIEIGDFGQQVYGKTFCDMCKGQYECDDCRLWWLQQPAGRTPDGH